MKPLLELCVDDVEGVKIATDEGIERVELCVELGCGGLTPPDEMLLEALKVAPAGGVHDRVLTTGGNQTVAAPEALRALQETAGEDFIIFGSGGLRSHNVAQIVEEADLREVHMRAPSGGNSGTSREEAARIVAALGR